MTESNIESIEKKIKGFIESEDFENAIEAYIELGMIYQGKKESPKSLTQFDQAIKIAKQIGNIELEARLTGLYGSGLKDLGNLQDASRYLKKALRLSEEIDNQLLMLDSNLHLAMVMVERGKHLEAISRLDNALMLSVMLNDNNRMLNVTNLMGNIFLRIESFEKALESFSTALEAARRLGNQSAEVEAQINLGKTLMADEGHVEAIEQFELALDLVDKINDLNLELEILNGLMKANFRVKKTHLAMIYGDQLVNKASNYFNPGRVLPLNYEYAIELSNAGKEAQALKLVDDSLILAGDHNEVDWEFRLNVIAGNLKFSEEDFSSSKGHFQKALDHTDHFQLHYENIVILSKLAALAVEEGELEESIYLTEQALEAAKEHEIKLLEGQQLVLLALSKNDLGRKDSAIQDIENAILIFEELKNDQLKEYAQNYLTEFKYAED